METSTASTLYSLVAKPAPRDVHSGHLGLGTCRSPQGDTLSASSFFLTRNGRPFLPVMGEIHFSRCLPERWEESLLKMKAGGIDMVATYVFWIHHEEEERVWNWTGRRDLRRFVGLCAKHGLYVFLRIGPWSHGECRNGGFPDWLYSKCKARSNDPAYLAYARKLYAQIFLQAEGFLFKDGGPVVGVQLDNEFRGCEGDEGHGHMMTLKHMAREAGFDVPFYTATGWGRSPIPQDEIIPVQGDYADATWEPGHDRLSPGLQFLFGYGPGLEPAERPDLAASDPVFADVTYRADRYPWCMAELGPGIQVTTNRRPIIYDDDAIAMGVVKIAGGANLLGYYMYHGGSHPVGKRGTLEEVDCPAINYDFQAPIGAFGCTNRKYHLLRRLHLFLRDFGEMLAPMAPVLPERRPEAPEDVDTLRFMARVRDGSGFLFLNNHRRYVESRMLSGQIDLELDNEMLRLPREPFGLPAGVTAVWPFNLNMEGVLLKFATAQLLSRLEANGDVYYFFFATPGVAPEFVFDGGSIASAGASKGRLENDGERLVAAGLEPGTDCVVSVTGKTGARVHICTFSSEESLRFYKATAWGRDRVFLTGASLLLDGDRLTLAAATLADLSFAVFPKLDGPLECRGSAVVRESDGIFTRYMAPFVGRKAHAAPRALAARTVECASDDRVWEFTIPSDAVEDLHDAFLRIDYRGDKARVLVDGTLVADDFYYGRPWTVGLEHLGPRALGGNVRLEIAPLSSDAKVYLEPEARPDFKGGTAIAELLSVEIAPEYALTFSPGAGVLLA